MLANWCEKGISMLKFVGYCACLYVTQQEEKEKTQCCSFYPVGFFLLWKRKAKEIINFQREKSNAKILTNCTTLLLFLWLRSSFEGIRLRVLKENQLGVDTNEAQIPGSSFFYTYSKKTKKRKDWNKNDKYRKQRKG